MKNKKQEEKNYIKMIFNINNTTHEFSVDNIHKVFKEEGYEGLKTITKAVICEFNKTLKAVSLYGKRKEFNEIFNEYLELLKKEKEFEKIKVTEMSRLYDLSEIVDCNQQMLTKTQQNKLNKINS